MYLPETWETEDVLTKIRKERDKLLIQNDWSLENIEIFMDYDIHMTLLKNCKHRTTEGKDCMTRSKILGMHVHHERMKGIYIIPTEKPPKEYYMFWHEF